MSNGSNGTEKHDPIMKQGIGGAPAQAVAAPDFRVSYDTMTKIINHLAQGPWHLVNPLITALQGCQPIAPLEDPK